MIKKIINSKALIHNLDFCKQCNKNIMVMVKADAYGHDMTKVVKILNNKVNFWGVANFQEALRLKKLTESAILVVSKTENFSGMIKNGIHITVDEIKELKEIETVAKKLNKIAYVHVAINTGMNRIGVKNIYVFKLILDFVYNSKYLHLAGVFTHLFDADAKTNHVLTQLQKFERFAKCIKDKGTLIHIGGSFAIMQKLPEYINMVRVGFFIYGCGNKKLKPVLSIVSKIIKISQCKKGELVGYGKTILKHNTNIALVPIGYADGVPRGLSNKGNVLINGKKFKIVGKICMDAFMIDIGNENIKIGDEVVVFNNAEDYAQIVQTSPYEILTNFAKARAKVLIN